MKSDVVDMRRAIFFASLIREASGVPVVLTINDKSGEVGFIMFGYHFVFGGEDRWGRCAKCIAEAWKIIITKGGGCLQN